MLTSWNYVIWCTYYAFSLFRPSGSCKFFCFEYDTSNSNSKNGASRHHHRPVARTFTPWSLTWSLKRMVSIKRISFSLDLFSGSMLNFTGLSLWTFWSNFAFENDHKTGASWENKKPSWAKSWHFARLAVLVDFVKDRASHWCEAHEESPNYGNFLDFDTFNLYQANFWVIEPATRDHGKTGCSYVELVAISMDDQRPKWFVSHAWLEPIVRFMLCLKQHALLRQLSLQSAYWVCASTWPCLVVLLHVGAGGFGGGVFLT